MTKDFKKKMRVIKVFYGIMFQLGSRQIHKMGGLHAAATQTQAKFIHMSITNKDLLRYFQSYYVQVDVAFHINTFVPMCDVHA